MSTKPRLTGRTAIAAWPERLGEVRREPTDENLQRLCHLLDAIDQWIVQRWDKPGHEERMAALTACRAEAREANRLVSGALREAARRRAEQTNRKRAAAKASDVASALPGRGSVQDCEDGPEAA
ncbi:MAG TPA: hypothetical protein VK988_16875 [Acidimicrobiales bacterium]|nr:hypothetical protein [Acidimicrobiales bacterium]